MRASDHVVFPAPEWVPAITAALRFDMLSLLAGGFGLFKRRLSLAGPNGGNLAPAQTFQNRKGTGKKGMVHLKDLFPGTKIKLVQPGIDPGFQFRGFLFRTEGMPFPEG